MAVTSVPIPRRPVNYKDIIFKVFWTGVAAAGGELVVVLADWNQAAAPFLIMAINYGLALIRQYLGTTAPELPPPSS